MSEFGEVDAVELRRYLESMAEAVAVFFHSLLKQKFRRDEALTLAQSWLITTISTAASSKPSESADDDA